MPRNSSGVYSLPLPPYVAGTTITSSAMNTNLNDIGTALTGSVAANGVTPMTGPLQLSAGTLAAPSLTLASDDTTGFYNSAAGSFTYVSAGVPTVVLSGTGLATTGFSASGNVTITGTITVGATTITGTVVPLAVRNTTNDALEHTLVTLGLGSGVGDVYGITGLGSGANDVTQIRHYIGAVEVYRYTATTFTSQRDLAVGASITIDSSGFIDLLEIAAPGAGAANVARLYSFDDGGTTRLAYVDSAAVITNLFSATQAQQETATATNMFVSPGVQKFSPFSLKAWLIYNSVADSITASQGVTSVTKNATGKFTVTVTAAFSSASAYSAFGWARAAASAATTALVVSADNGDTKTTTQMQFAVNNFGDANADSPEIFIGFVGDLA